METEKQNRTNEIRIQGPGTPHVTCLFVSISSKLFDSLNKKQVNWKSRHSECFNEYLYWKSFCPVFIQTKGLVKTNLAKITSSIVILPCLSKRHIEFAYPEATGKYICSARNHKSILNGSEGKELAFETSGRSEHLWVAVCVTYQCVCVLFILFQRTQTREYLLHIICTKFWDSRKIETNKRSVIYLMYLSTTKYSVWRVH